MLSNISCAPLIFKGMSCKCFLKFEIQVRFFFCKVAPYHCTLKELSFSIGQPLLDKKRLFFFIPSFIVTILKKFFKKRRFWWTIKWKKLTEPYWTLPSYHLCSSNLAHMLESTWFISPHSIVALFSSRWCNHFWWILFLPLASKYSSPIFGCEFFPTVRKPSKKWSMGEKSNTL